MLSLLVAFLIGYLAYRVVRGGLFWQSKPNRLDLCAIVLVVLGALWLLDVSVSFNVST